MRLAPTAARVAGRVAHEAGVAGARGVVFDIHVASAPEATFAKVPIEPLCRAYEFSVELLHLDGAEHRDHVIRCKIAVVIEGLCCQFAGMDVVLAGVQPPENGFPEAPFPFRGPLGVNEGDQSVAGGLGLCFVGAGFLEVSGFAGLSVSARVDPHAESVAATIDAAAGPRRLLLLLPCHGSRMTQPLTYSQGLEAMPRRPNELLGQVATSWDEVIRARQVQVLAYARS
jgi:hypothetical protein